MSNNFVLFSDNKKKKIIQDFKDIILNNNPLKNFPINKFENAVSGVMDKSKTKKEMYEVILRLYNDRIFPIIADNSLTAWCNQAVEQYGLEIRDIMSMKFGDKMNLILIDRNAGEYFTSKIGSKVNPRNEGLTYAEYIHGEGLTGILNMYDDGVIHAPFTWEINGGCNSFWGPIDKNDYKMMQKLDPKTKVGWRGPAIDMLDTKYLPKLITHYGTWFNDYVPYRYYNYLDIKRIKPTPRKN